MRKILTIAVTALALTLFAVPGALAEEPLDLQQDSEALMTPAQTDAPAVETDVQEPLFLQGAAADIPVEQCGNRYCPKGLVCCNASCGICTQPGEFCIQIACDNPGDLHR